MYIDGVGVVGSWLAAGFGLSAGGVVSSTTASCPHLVGKERASRLAISSSPVSLNFYNDLLYAFSIVSLIILMRMDVALGGMGGL
jgi:hypothetical protein